MNAFVNFSEGAREGAQAPRAVGSAGAVADLIDSLPAVDHHCHGVITGPADAGVFEELASESDWAQPAGGNVMDSPLGVAIRSVCGPLLGLDKHVDGATYVRTRADLPFRQVTRTLLAASGSRTLLVDTGHRSDAITDPTQLGDLAGADAHEIVRLEALAERLGRDGVSADGFYDAFCNALETALRTGVGVKSVVAYRIGLDFDPQRPTPAEISAEASRWLQDAAATGNYRLAHPVLHRALLWAAVDAGKPIQVHVGFGDSDIVMHRCDPTHLTQFLRATADIGTPIMLLHNYPFIREAGYLAHVYPHVYLDTGAACGYSGPSAISVVRQSLELAPFTKILYSSDAFGLPELFAVGSRLHRNALARIFGDWMAADALSEADAHRYLELMMAGNAQRVYDLPTRAPAPACARA